MCGICGELVFDPNDRVRGETLTAMRSAIAHRGPDGTGLFVTPDARAAFERAYALDPGAPLIGQKRGQVRGIEVDEVAKCVDVNAVTHGGRLDPRHELDACGPAANGSRSAAGDGIVIGDAEHLDARRHRPRHELGRRTEAIGRRGMSMEIDQRDDLARAAPAVRGR